MRWKGTLFLLGLSALLPVSGLAGKPGVVAEPFGAGDPWPAFQYARADAKGRVYVLRADTLEVYPVGKDGLFGEPSKLETARAESTPVLSAAMGDGPGEWMLLRPTGLQRFVDGKEKPLPPIPWEPYRVGYRRGSPVVSVLPWPAPVNGRVTLHKGKEPSAGPVIMELNGDRWSVLVEEAWPAEPDHLAIREGFGRSLLGDREGKLWAARNYAYVLDRYSPSGRPLLQVKVENGQATHPKDVAVPAELSAEDRKHFHAFVGVLKVPDLVEGPDHLIYLAVQNGGQGLALDRYDPAQGTLQRVELRLQVPGFLTLAAGRDALYLAAPRGDNGRWRIAWEALNQADWKTVSMNGAARQVPPPEGKGRQPVKKSPTRMR
jgi:hypothetical protein